MAKINVTRRDFLHATSLMGSTTYALFAQNSQTKPLDVNRDKEFLHENKYVPKLSELIDFSPAKWIWYPSRRTLQNTFLLFRKEVYLEEIPSQAFGWIFADSRYLLYVNGQRIQWGPAPSDPRWPEADPIDLLTYFVKGKNIIGVQVLFFGQGDGTWPIGKPGFIFKLDLGETGGEKLMVISDTTWQVHLCQAWPPGHYKRWYLRALQEEFDARVYPYKWNTTNFKPDKNWLSAMAFNLAPDKPPSCSEYPEYMLEMRGPTESSYIKKRSVPLLKEYEIPVKKLSEVYLITWHRPPQEYFEFEPPDSFSALPATNFREIKRGIWEFEASPSHGMAFTFELEEQIVGWPYFTIEATATTTVELMVHEGHQIGGPPLLNTHFHSWTRFVCKKGLNNFETFDFESCRWIQLHIHGSQGKIQIKNIGVRRRIFPWPQNADIRCSEKPLQRLFEASVNTLNNCAQETLVDGMGRERQQYSGDCGHQIHAIYFSFNEYQLPARYLKTFSQGLTVDGFFLDCWPAYDRLARLMERQMEFTKWGPLLDHGVGFVFDNYYHYLYSGRLEDLHETYPRLLRFVEYLKSIQQTDGLLPVENIGIPHVWIDHVAYLQQRHKQCAFNLYTSAMLIHSLAPLCRAFGEEKNARLAEKFGEVLYRASVNNFWDTTNKIFINNLPWLSEEKNPRMCDRSLATAILYNQCPELDNQASLNALIECPPEMGFSYPANAGWRLWALGKMDRSDIILKDLRERWANMNSVILNNTLQENWSAEPDSGSLWSHCPVAPLYVLYMNILGIKPLEPAFACYEIYPRLADLNDISIKAQTPNGPIFIESKGTVGNRKMVIGTPAKGNGELVLPKSEKVDLEWLRSENATKLTRYRLPKGKKIILKLRYV